MSRIERFTIQRTTDEGSLKTARYYKRLGRYLEKFCRAKSVVFLDVSKVSESLPKPGIQKMHPVEEPNYSNIQVYLKMVKPEHITIETMGKYDHKVLRLYIHQYNRVIYFCSTHVAKKQGLITNEELKEWKRKWKAQQVEYVE